MPHKMDGGCRPGAGQLCGQLAVGATTMNKYVLVRWREREVEPLEHDEDVEWRLGVERVACQEGPDSPPGAIMRS